MAPKLSIHLGGSTRATSGLTPGNLQFAAQLGVTHIVTSDEAGEMIPKHNGFWAVEDLVAVRERVEAGGLTLAAIENFPADHWDRILLGADGREEQLENLGRTITNMGKAGIPCMGYCFSLTGAFGRAETVARGGAPSEGFAESEGTHLLPLPVGYVWNRWVEDPGRATLPTFRTGPDGVKEHREAVDRHKAAGGEFLAPVPVEEMWERFEWFLTRLLPFAEAAGVRLAAHPNDPPLPVHRGMGCPLNTPQAYQRLLGISDSYFNACEFCQGTVAQMEQGGEFVQGAIREYGKRIAYVHCECRLTLARSRPTFSYYWSAPPPRSEMSPSQRGLGC